MTQQQKNKPFHKLRAFRNGYFVFVVVTALTLGSLTGIVAADALGTDVEELRRHAEQAIAEERTDGDPELADAMEEILPQLLEEVRQSQTEAPTDDTVTEHGLKRGQLDLADHMDARLSSNSQAGLFTLFVRSEGVHLTLTPSESLQAVTGQTTVTVNPGSGPAGVTSPGNSNNDTVGFSGSPGNSGGGSGVGKGKK